MYMGFVVPGYGFAYFAPTILKGWHYSSTQSQLRTVPVSIVAWLVAMAIATASDHTKHRYLYLLLCALLSSIGLILLLTTHFSQGAQYTGMFFLYSGAMSGMPMAACYFQTNLAGHKRRSIGSAFQIGFGNVGGIVATFLFLAKDAPYYRSGYAVTLGFVGLAALAGSMYVLGIRRENRLKEEGNGRISYKEFE